jgi:hypothetical protein
MWHFFYHQRQEMRRLEGLIQDLNIEVYNPVGLNIRWPRKVAFLFVSDICRHLGYFSLSHPCSSRSSTTYVLLLLKLTSIDPPNSDSCRAPSFDMCSGPTRTLLHPFTPALMSYTQLRLNILRPNLINFARTHEGDCLLMFDNDFSQLQALGQFIGCR